jgi:outer membrane protein OmpA-like peptidoglycan-associated protein
VAEKHSEEKEKHAQGHGGDHWGGSHEEREGAPEWLISFADNVTLIMGFFVIMLAFSMGPKGGGVTKGDEGGAGSGIESPPNFLDAALSIREAFHNPVDLNSQDPNDQMLVQRILWRRGLGATDQTGPEGREHDMQSLRPSKYYSLCGVVPFEHGSAVISSEAARSLDAAAKHMKGLRFIVDVRGNVSADEAFEDPQHNMRLGFDRALAVADALVKLGLDWRQLHVISCADGDRVQPIAYDQTGHQRNRRVEIVVTDKMIPDASSSDHKSDQP